MKLPRLQFSLRSLLLTAVLTACVGYLLHLRELRARAAEQYYPLRQRLGWKDLRDSDKIYYQWDEAHTICRYWIPEGQHAKLIWDLARMHTTSPNSASGGIVRTEVVAELKNSGTFSVDTPSRGGIPSLVIVVDGKRLEYPLTDMKNKALHKVYYSNEFKNRHNGTVHNIEDQTPNSNEYNHVSLSIESEVPE